MQILVNGWSVTAVESSPPWCYSIGLLEQFAHPELVVMDLDIEVAHRMINWVASLVRDGRGVPDRDVLRSEGFRLVDVHPRYLATDLFASWTRYYGEPPQPGDFVQLLSPSEALCPCHQGAYRRLDRGA